MTPMATDGPYEVDYDYCLSSFLALRHVHRAGVAWTSGVRPILARRSFDDLMPVVDAAEMDHFIARSLGDLDPDTTGVLLSGGMDSAIVASYLPPGSRAFTFRFMDAGTPSEVTGAAAYAERLDLRLIEVPIEMNDYLSSLPALMRHRGSPVHSIEPQIYKALTVAQDLGVERVLTGENADSLFGGFDGLVGSEWSFDDFVRRYSFVDPAAALRHPVDYRDAFESARVGDGVDAHLFMSTVFADESLNSYLNPARLLGVELISPFAGMRMAEPLDVSRVQNGESKYLVRDLFRRRYAGEDPSPKLPMPRSVGALLADWEGPARPEFVEGAADRLRPDQRWMIFVLEQFLEAIDAG